MEYLTAPKELPSLNISDNDATVDVKIIDSTTRIMMPDVQFICVPHIKGHDYFHCPSYSFLVSNRSRRVLFDLGVRKGFETEGSPFVPDRVNKLGFKVTVEKDVGEILDDHASATGVSSKDIEAVILSHHHWDHTGNIGYFPSSTDVVIGPGFKKEYLPGYPKNPKSSLWDPDFEGRNIREVECPANGLHVGKCAAHDYFGDGSFYLLSTPGHTIGHLSALARVSASPPSYILMIGDACHHAGEIRPSEYLPLPKYLDPSPWPKSRPSPCPGELLQNIHPDKSNNAPFYKPKPGFNHDSEEAERSIEKLLEFDANSQVLTVIAHDEVLIDHLPLFPRSINDSSIQELDEKTRWLFTRDFEEKNNSRLA